MEIVDPRGQKARPPEKGLAPRLMAPPAKLRLGFLINEEGRGAPDFYGYTLAIEEAARARFDIAEVVRACRPLLSRPAEPDLLEGFRGVQGVINGLAK